MNAQRFFSKLAADEKNPLPHFSELRSPNQTPRLACERNRL